MHGTLPKPAWFRDWAEDVCALIASGPSVTQEIVDKLRGRCRVAVVNNGYEIAPWADVLYAADGRWWDCYQDSRKFSGIKVTPDAVAAKRYGLNLVSLLGKIDDDADRIAVDRPGSISRGGNSGFQLVNLVTQFGSKRQIWIGFDFVGEHWHDKHPDPLKNPRSHTLDKWRRRLDSNASVLAGLGVEIINVSAISALTAYPKASLDGAFRRFGL